MTHDDKRIGTIDLFAAMDIATGEVHTRLNKGHTGEDVLAFVKQIDRSVPADLDVHIIPDNRSAHKTPASKEWLEDPAAAGGTCTSLRPPSSWLNLIQRWFKELTDKRLRRGAFTGVADHPAGITAWADHWNNDPKPFIWKATAEDIIAKVSRGR